MAGANQGRIYYQGYDPYAQAQIAYEQRQREKDRQAQAAAAAQGSSALSSLVGEYNKAFGEAKFANEQRYQQMLGITDKTTGQRVSDTASAYGQQSADIMQQLARLGMANTTIAPTMRLGVEREKQSALNRLADEMQGTKLGIMERRTDAYPDQALVASLAGALGQGAGTSGLGVLSQLGKLKLS